MMSRYQAGAVKGEPSTTREKSPFYSRKFRDIDLSKIGTQGGFERLPFTDRGDLRGAYPLGPMSVPEERVVRVHPSSGTTGAPVIIPYTARDADDRAIMFERRYGMAGVTPTDRIWITPGHGP